MVARFFGAIGIVLNKSVRRGLALATMHGPVLDGGNFDIAHHYSAGWHSFALTKRTCATGQFLLPWKPGAKRIYGVVNCYTDVRDDGWLN